MNRDESYIDPRGRLVYKLTSGVAGLVHVTGTVGEVCTEQGSGDFTGIGFRISEVQTVWERFGRCSIQGHLHCRQIESL